MATTLKVGICKLRATEFTLLLSLLFPSHIGWEGLTTYKIQMPRNSSFVIICASQAYSAGQEELPEHLRSKNVSTLTSRASSRKFTEISSAENQPSVPGSHRAAAPASSPLCGTPQNGRNPQGNTSGPAQSVEAAQ